MGEYADLMLEGHMCEQCGTTMHNAQGYPQSCRSCRKDENIANMQAQHAAAKKGPCPTCGKKVKLIGMANHMKDAHGVRS